MKEWRLVSTIPLFWMVCSSHWAHLIRQDLRLDVLPSNLSKVKFSSSVSSLNLDKLSLSAEWKRPASRSSACSVSLSVFLDLACESERVSPRYSSLTLGEADGNINTRGPVRMCACVWVCVGGLVILSFLPLYTQPDLTNTCDGHWHQCHSSNAFAMQPF